MDPRRSSTLRVVSLNVCRLRSQGPRDQPRARLVGAFLSELDADFVALQELEHGGCAESLFDTLGGSERHWILGRHSRSGLRGVALSSRVVPHRPAEGRLSVRGIDDKGYAQGFYDLPGVGRTIEVLAVHLDPFSRTARHRQIAMLAKTVAPAKVPRVVLGDLNAMTVRDFLRGRDHDDTATILADALGVKASAAPPKTFPDAFPLFAIDWILASSELELINVQAIRARVSDHAAIVADLRLRASNDDECPNALHGSD